MFVEHQLCTSELNISHTNFIFLDEYYLLTVHDVSDTIPDTVDTEVNRTKFLLSWTLHTNDGR